MLWYKAWLETRVLFAICLVAITASSWYTVYSDYHQETDSVPTLHFYYSVAHGAHEALGAWCLVPIVFLTAGGLLRELAVGAAPFTLALPFSRTRLMGIRIGTGLLQTVILILVPSTAIRVESMIVGKPYPLSQIWFHIVLLVSGGVAYFAIALLIASIVKGEYTAPLISFCVVIGSALVLRDPPWQKYSPLHFMWGSDYFDRPSGLLLGPVPWIEAGVWVAVATILVAASVKAIGSREF